MHHDLKNYKANEEGDSIIIDPDLAIFLLICGGFVGFVFRSFL